jgi:mannose-6-phosphate isomerase
VTDVGPVVLGANQPPRFYRGGERIAAFRASVLRERQAAAAPASASPVRPGDGAGPAGPTAPSAADASRQPSASDASKLPDAADDSHLPEDWVGSATTLFGTAADGLTRLPDGRLLRDAIDGDPAGYLGPGHVRQYGSSPALLVKLLDAGERLPVHCHPDDTFARRHLASHWGKTEAWIVIDAAPGSEVHLGFREPVTEEALAGWVATQDPAMLRALNRMPVRPGDAILVPAGIPHAIGAGVFVVELQEPTDLSVLLEWDAFPLDGRSEGHLGLGFDQALRCVDRSAWSPEQLARLRGPAAAAGQRPVTAMFPPAASPYFAADLIRPGHSPVAVGPGFAILVVTAGSGLLRTEHGGDVPVSRGMTVLVPYAAGGSEIAGDCEVIRCIPPNGAPPDSSS